MTTFTYELTDVWAKLVRCSEDGSNPIGVDSVWQATPDIVVSENTTFKQRTLRGMRQMISGYTPTLISDNPEGKHIPIYLINEDDILKTMYLEVTDVEKDSFWYMINCVPYKEGMIQIDALHPESTLVKNHINDHSGYNMIDIPEIILRTKLIEHCDGCGSMERLHTCGSYDDDGEPTHLVDLCERCRGDYYPYPDGSRFYNQKISLAPHHDWDASYKWGGIMSYSYKATDGALEPYGFKPSKEDVAGSPWMGAEIEVGCAHGYFEEPHHYAKEVYRRMPKGLAAICSDSSLTSDRRSFEIITVPARLNKLKNGLKGIFKDDLVTKEADEKGYKYGLHVHMDRKALKPMQLSKMVTFMNAKENQGFLISVAGRPATNYTRFEDDKRKIRKKHGTEDGSRSTALNLCNSATVEFRLFNTPHSYEELCLRLEFCDALAMYCRNIAGLGDLGFTRFLDWVRSTHNGYPNLKKFSRGLHYRNVDIPLSSIADTKDSKYARLWARASELEHIDVSVDKGASRELIGKTITAINSSGTVDAVTNDRVISAIMAYLYEAKCNSQKDRFWKLVTRDVCEYLPDSLYFEYANGKTIFAKGNDTLAKATLVKTIKQAFTPTEKEQ